MKPEPTHKTRLYLLKYFYFALLVVFTGFLAPQEVKEISPKAWGWLEGKLGWDLTGFCFTPLGGNGSCRIVNSAIAFSTPGSSIVFGEIVPPGGKPYPHMWVVKDEATIDQVCPPEDGACRERREFARVNPDNLQIESEAPRSEKDRVHIKWGLKYLEGLKDALCGGGERARFAGSGNKP